MRISKRLVRVFWLFAALVLMSGSRATASSFFVTTTNDSIHPGTLRAAIIAANRAGGNSFIRLVGSSRGGGVYHLTIPGPDEDNAQNGDLDITRGTITIIGHGSNMTIDATALGDRVFQIFPGAHLTLENLIITGGVAPPAPRFQFIGEFGGGIYNSGTLTLQHCIITNNLSGPGRLRDFAGGTGGGDGGGIYNSGFLVANNCQIIGNSSGSGVAAEGGNGGGLRNDGRCLLTECVINGNRAGDGDSVDDEFSLGDGASGGNGGAIYNSGTMILQNCSVGGNSAGDGGNGVDPLGIVNYYTPGGLGGNGGSGGGIYNTGKLESDFSSIYNNSCGNGGNGDTFNVGGAGGAGGNGAGIFNVGALSLNTSTISSNSAGNGGTGGDTSSAMLGPGPGGGAGGSGGGIYSITNLQLNFGSLVISSCTVALNTAGLIGPLGRSNSPGGIPITSAADGSGGGVWAANAVVRNL